MAFLGIYRALYDYPPQSSEELQLSEGDLLFLLERSSEDNWWKCKKKAASDEEDEPEGLVPDNYVEEATPTQRAKALYDYTKQTDEELSFPEGVVVDVFDDSDPDWTLIGLNGEYGFAPAIYMEALPSESPTADTSSPAAPPPMPARPPAVQEDVRVDDPSISPSFPAPTDPAAGIAAIIAQRPGAGAAEPSSPPMSTQRALAAPPSIRVHHTGPGDIDDGSSPPPPPPKPESQSQPPVHIDTSVAQAMSSSSYNRSAPRSYQNDYDSPQRSPGGYHLYNINETVSHMGKNKKLPTTLGINIAKGVIMISPEKSRDGPSQVWTAEKLTHYSIEGKHVFVELVRPSKSIDFHAGAKDTAQQIVAHLGELAGASRATGLDEVLAASAGSAGASMKKGTMLYHFVAHGDDEVTVGEGEEVIILDDHLIILDDHRSKEWWMVRRLKNGTEGVVPAEYVQVTGIVSAPGGVTSLNTARNTVEQNRREEERLAREAAKKGPQRGDGGIPERGSSLAGHEKDKRPSKDTQAKSLPNQSRIRTWSDRTGSFKVDAAFINIALHDETIRLHKQNGVKIAVPVSKMSVEDLEYIERSTGLSLELEMPSADINRRRTQRGNTKGAQVDGSKKGKEEYDSAGVDGSKKGKEEYDSARVDGSKKGKKEYDWFDFFLGCGVNPQICERYANSFSKDQMGPEVLPDVNEKLLRTLGLKEGDILRVMKHLDEQYGRNRSGDANGEGGLFSGPGGALRNNTKKGRPAPAVQTNDVVSGDALKPKDGSKTTSADNPTASESKTGFDDDDPWNVKPAGAAPSEASKRPASPLIKVNEEIAGLSMSDPPLQPTPAPAPQTTSQSPAPQQPQQPPGANADIFNKIASLAPARPRPQAPPAVQQALGGGLGPPPERASSAPGFPAQKNGFGPPPLQQQLTGYQDQSRMQPQPTSFQGYPPQQQPPGFSQPPSGFQPQPTGVQAMQQNYPALQPQPTGLNFQPQSQFGQHQQAQHYGAPQYQQQQFINGAQAGSPFADQPYPSFAPPQPTGFPSAPLQTGFNMGGPQPTSTNGFPAPPPAPPQLPPQQTGGVFGPLQPLSAQKTGPPPPVRFGVKGAQKVLAPQPTGRANLTKASTSPLRSFPPLALSRASANPVFQLRRTPLDSNYHSLDHPTTTHLSILLSIFHRLEINSAHPSSLPPFLPSRALTPQRPLSPPCALPLCRP